MEPFDYNSTSDSISKDQNTDSFINTNYIKNQNPINNLENINHNYINDLDHNYISNIDHNYKHSITQGKLTANSENLNGILHKELDDISVELGNKITNAIGQMREDNIDREKYKEVIFIKKRILNDGNKKIVNVNVSEKLIPKNEPVFGNDFKYEPISRDFGTRAFLAGFLFLIAGLIFTTSLKIYQQWLRKKYIKMTEEKVNNEKKILI